MEDNSNQDPNMKVINESDCRLDINNYQNFEVISRCEFGQALKATDKRTGKEVFMKGISYTFFKKGMISKFVHDLRISKDLDIPNVVKFIGFCPPIEVSDDESQDQNYRIDCFDPKWNKRYLIKFAGPIIVTEYMKGENVLQLTEEYFKSSSPNDKMNPTIRCKIIYGVASIMKKIHEKKIIFQDLRIFRTFLDDNCNPIICGSRFTPTYDIDPCIAHPAGHPFYLAPEIFEKEEIDLAYDVYTFGLFVYQMFSPHFNGKQIDKLKSKFHDDKMLDRPKNVPDCYWELIVACLKKEPGDRPSFDVILDELKNDQWALEEFGTKTNIDQLHEYQKLIGN